MEYVLQGVEQMMAVTGFEPQLSGDGFHPQREGSVYKKLKGSWEILEPVFTQQGKLPRWAEPLAAYMTGRYKKAAATRQSNQELKASWSEKKEAEVRKAEEEKIRARTMEEWTNNFVRRLEQERRGSSRDEE